MNDALSKIMEATNAFNASMANASEDFNRLAGAQEFLMAAVDAAKAYARGHGNLPRVEIGQNIVLEEPAPAPAASTSEFPSFLRSPGPIVAADEENAEQLTFNPQNPAPLKPAAIEPLPADNWDDEGWAQEVERKLGT